MRRFSKWLCLLMAVALMTPSMAMAAGLTGGSGVYGVYRGKDDALFQTWYTDPLVTGGANYVVGVHDGNAYYQTANADGATSALYRVAVNLLPDTIKASAEMSEEQVKAGTTGEPELLAPSVSGHALLDEVSGYVYYVDGADTKSVHVLAWYPTLGKVDVVACTSEEPVLALSMSVNGPVLTCQSGRFLYVQLLSRSVALPADEEPVAESAMASGVEIILTESGKLSLRLDAVNNLTLPIAEDVSAFAAYDGAVYYLRRTRWMTEIARFDLTSRNNEVICRMLRELMPQLVAAGEYLYVIDTDYTVYRMSPSSGKYATYMLLKEPYADVPEYEPLLASAGEELVVYDRLKEGGTVENARYYYNVYVGSTDRTSPAPTPGATDAPTTTPITTVYKDLKRKDRNTDVKNLQEKLIELGYLDDTADGIFGEKTQVAIEQLQSDLGMTVTGVATAELQRMLFAGEVPAYNPYLPLKRGDRGTRVSRMQAELKALGYYAGAADGVYGKGTEKAVAAFQKQEGLNQTGQADEETLRALFSESASQNLSYIELRSGDSGKRVAELISRLVELYYLPSTAEGNEYTSQVARGVRHFQRQNGFDANSVASVAMQEALFDDDAPDYDGYVTLVPGDRNQRVRELQARLIRLGYQTGYTDGVYGSKTKKAVSAFQKRAGIKATGTADEATQRALFKSNAPTAATPTPKPTATPDPFWDLGSGVTVEVTADGTKVFEAPSTDSTLLGTAKKGTQLTMLATNSTWGRVRNKFGETGYILLKYLVYVDPTPTPTVTATPSVAPTDTPAPAPTDTPAPAPTDTPAPAPTDTPAPAPTDTPAPAPTDTPAPAPTDTPAPAPTDTPAPAPTDTPKPEPTPYNTEWTKDADSVKAFNAALIATNWLDESFADTDALTDDILEAVARFQDYYNANVANELTSVRKDDGAYGDIDEKTYTAILSREYVNSEPPEPVPTETPEPVPTETPEPVPTETPEPVPTETPEPVPTETPKPEPTPYNTEWTKDADSVKAFNAALIATNWLDESFADTDALTDDILEAVARFQDYYNANVANELTSVRKDDGAYGDIDEKTYTAILSREYVNSEPPEPVPTETPEPVPTETPEPVPTETPEPAPTETPEPVPTETPEPVPTETPEPVPTETPEPVPTETPEPVPTETPEPVPTETPEPVPTETPEPVPTETPEPVPTETPEPVPTETPEPVPTETPEPVPTDTPKPEPTPYNTAWTESASSVKKFCAALAETGWLDDALANSGTLTDEILEAVANFQDSYNANVANELKSIRKDNGKYGDIDEKTYKAILSRKYSNKP